VWSPDSKAIYIPNAQPEQGAVSGIYRVAIPDGKPQLVAGFEGINAWLNFPPPMLGLSPEGQFLYMNDASAVQIYSMKWPEKAK
jgi:hypothetical protein